MGILTQVPTHSCILDVRSFGRLFFNRDVYY